MTAGQREGDAEERLVEAPGVPGFYVHVAPDLPPSAVRTLGRAIWLELTRWARTAFSRRLDVSDLREHQHGHGTHLTRGRGSRC